MTLLDATPPKPHRPVGRYVLAAVVVILLLSAGYALFRNYPEEHAISRFLKTVEQGDYRDAYRLWQPSETYTFDEFLHDWGPTGDYGKIRTFNILGSRSKGANTVIVTVSINNEEPARELLVDRQTKGLAYSPF